MKKILVLCTGNSCRSQIAEGYLRHFANGRAEIYSAGMIAHGVNPKAVETMRNDGIDISLHVSKRVEKYLNGDFDFIITLCDDANAHCPAFPSKAKRIHQNFPDPSWTVGTDEAKRAEFLKTRDLIKVYCRVFVEENL